MNLVSPATLFRETFLHCFRYRYRSVSVGVLLFSGILLLTMVVVYQQLNSALLALQMNPEADRLLQGFSPEQLGSPLIVFFKLSPLLAPVLWWVPILLLCVAFMIVVVLPVYYRLLVVRPLVTLVGVWRSVVPVLLSTIGIQFFIGFLVLGTHLLIVQMPGFFLRGEAMASRLGLHVFQAHLVVWLLLVLLFILPRFYFGLVIAAGERIGSIASLRRSFRMTHGRAAFIVGHSAACFVLLLAVYMSLSAAISALLSALQPSIALMVGSVVLYVVFLAYLQAFAVAFFARLGTAMQTQVTVV